MKQEKMTTEEYKRDVLGEKPNKYHARPVVVDGHRFPSRKEARRYSELKLLERGGVISNLELQPRYDIEVNGLHVCSYVGDFRYWHVKQKRQILEDTKGWRTDVYKLKVRLMKAVFGIDILET